MTWPAIAMANTTRRAKPPAPDPDDGLQKDRAGSLRDRIRDRWHRRRGPAERA